MRTLSTSANFWFEQQSSAFKASYASFLAQYPAYKDTAILDRLRKDEFSRLDKAKEVYLDYMGGCLWPKVLVSRHASILKSGLFGDANSDSPCATRSDRHIAAARSAVLDFFDAPSSDYVCVFTANATNALKLVGENFPFTSGSSLVIPVDCHNSVNGIRTFAETAGATVEYLESPLWGGIYESDANAVIAKYRSTTSESPSLFVLTGQSNITGIRPDMSILDEAHSAGFATVVDAAALASSTRVSLQQIPAADAMVVSFYKMFGYPTGVGGLIAKKSFLATLGKKRFGGGATDFAHAPDLNARLEEGTLNYGALSTIAPGLDFLSTYMPYMSLRLPTLHQYLHSALESLVYPETQTPLVHVHTRPRAMQLNRMLKRKLSTLQSASRVTLSTDAVPSAPSGEGQGYVVSCSFYTSQGVYIPLTQISCLASASGISLRTGCVCNPGGAAALRGEIFQERMKDLSMVDHTMDLNEVYMFMGGAEMAGVVRISLGLVSNFEDIWRFVCWARGLLDETKREKDLERLGCLHEDECSKEMDS